MRRLVLLLMLLPLLALTTPAGADTRTLVDDNQLDPEIHSNIDIDKVTVTYKRASVRAVVRFFDLEKVRRLRFFIEFATYQDPSDSFSPKYGQFVEMRLAPSGKKSVVNWLIDPELDSYTKRQCKGVTATPDYRRDTITYVVQRRCMHFIKSQGLVRAYVSARKYNAAHWHGGDPALSTGDKFDTTYDVVTPR